jgi:hypothetical protein
MIGNVLKQSRRLASIRELAVLKTVYNEQSSLNTLWQSTTVNKYRIVLGLVLLLAMPMSCGQVRDWHIGLRYWAFE